METTQENLTCILIQDFGKLLVIDLNFNLVGISRLLQDDTNDPEKDYIGKSMDVFFCDRFSEVKTQLNKLVKNVANHDLPKQILSIRIKSQNYYFKCHRNKELVYLEWEPQLKKNVSASKLNELGFLLDRNYPNRWSMVCKAVNKFLNFDRVFVLQVYDTGQSKVIAEDSSSSGTFTIQKEYSDSFMTNEAIAYYQSTTYRYASDLGSRNELYFETDSELDPFCTQLATFPSLHEEYFISLGMKSVIIFPIIVSGVFWGLIIGYHHAVQQIDLQERKLCTFFVQNASNKYDSTIKQNLLEHNEHLKNIERTLLDRLYDSKTVNSAMLQSMNILTQTTRSDGLAIFNEGELFLKGKTPNAAQINEIVAYIDSLKKGPVFKDHKFKKNHGSHFSKPLNFAGLIAYRLDYNNDYYIIWFRKEVKFKITHVTAISQNSKPQVARKHIKVWEKSIIDSAVPWDENDLNFIHILRNAINNSIIYKAKEKELRSEELETINNELEMFTFNLSHELKNPLSVLTLGLSFLFKNATDIPEEKLNSWHKNLISSVGNIEDIINNMVALSQNKVKEFVKELVPMDYSVRKIVEEAIFLSGSQKYKVTYGKLYPIWGEKSALNQVFVNIIGNAIKYSQSIDMPEISIRSFQMTDHIVYRIKDNGIGIPKNNLESIFDMFNRGDNALEHTGSGIGLSLVKRIMERMGGAVRVTSVKLKGTRVDLYFPSENTQPKK